MKKDQERLLNLYKEKKITEEDFNILSRALSQKKTRSQRFFHHFVNPFDRFAGYQAVAIGLGVLLATSLVASLSQIHFPGLFDLKIFKPADSPGLPLIFQKILLQNMIISLSLAMAFYFSSRLAKKSSLRFVDFLGTAMMARFPYLIASVVFLILHLSEVKLHFDKVEDVSTYTLIAITFTALLSIVWLGATYFYSLKESSGLKGKSLWVSFVFSLLIVEVFTLYLNQQLI